MTQQPTHLPSEDTIINAPMSFIGSGQRIWRIRRAAHGNTLGLVVLTAIAVTLIPFAWAGVTVWYLIAFVLLGLVTIPYRLLRRGARKRNAEALRHRETLAAIARDRP